MGDSIRHTDDPADEDIVRSHRKLREEFEDHKKEYSAHLEEYSRHRRELCEDYDKNLQFSKEVNKTAVAALHIATRNAEATAVLVEGVTTIKSIRKFITWSGSSVVLLAAVTWLAAKFPHWLASLLR